MIIEKLLAGESKTIEYKRELPEKSDKYLKSVVAFSNTSGGKIIIGIEDKTRKVAGIPTEKAFEIIDSITNVILDSCTPQIVPDVTLQSIEDKTVIVVSVYPGRQRPYYITSLGKANGTFIRTSGSSRRADHAQIKELEFEGSNRYFDQTYAVGHTVSDDQIQSLCQDIKMMALKACKTEHEKKSVKAVTKGNLLTWGVLTERDGELYPTNAFVLLTENDFPQAKIQCAVFKGTTRSIFIDKREYDGPIYEQIEKAYQFVLRNIKLGATINGLFRVEGYELPVESIRELICNAVTHRSYLDEGSVQVALFDDRLEVTSPGMLFGGLTIEDLKEGQSRPRNRGIASVFVAMKMIEQWGTGIPRMFELCAEYGLSEPELLEIGMDFRVNLYRKQITDNPVKPMFGDVKPSLDGSKPMFDDEKPSFDEMKQRIFTIKGRKNTKENAWAIFEKMGIDLVFSRKDIMNITKLSESSAGDLIHKLINADLIIQVRGQGKGRYRFKL